MNNIFKAGDFTSGKMADIFKKCYMNDIAIIDHKQFGRSYMIPVEFFRALAKNEMLQLKSFVEFVEINFGSVDAFNLADDEHCFKEIKEYFGGEVEADNWFSILAHATILNGGICNYVRKSTNS